MKEFDFEFLMRNAPIFVMFAHEVPYEPVLHCKPDDYIANSILSLRILNNGMYNNTTVFTNITVDKTKFSDAANLLATMIQDKSYNTEQRIAQSRLVHSYMKQNLPYAKTVCAGDVNTIKLSGYDSNYQPTKAGQVETSGILKVTKWKTAGSYKVYLIKRKNKKNVEQDPSTHPRNVLYSMQVTTTPDDAASWKNSSCGPVASTKLILVPGDYTYGKKNYVRVFGSNSAGSGAPCKPMDFSPEF